MPTNDNAPLLVERQTDLDQLCTFIEPASEIYLDTEFVRTNTYAPHLGLVQVSAEGHIACIDPLAELDLASFWRLLYDPERPSIWHSCKQDMEVLWYTCNEVIPNVIDTQICAGLLGYPAQIGYAGLAKELVNADIAKTQTRTDWSRRPLTEAQIHYAAEDVEHLPEMHRLLREKLIEAGRYEWALEDSRALCDASLYKPDIEGAWQRLKSIPFLPPEQQARARALAAWRERRAVQIDKPRGWILADKALLQMAERDPSSRNDLRKIDDLPDAIVRKQGDKLLNCVQDANRAFADGELKLEQQFPDRDKDKARLKKLGTIVKRHADELGIAAEIIASRKDLQALIRGGEVPKLASGWRHELLGTAFFEAASAD